MKLDSIIMLARQTCVGRAHNIPKCVFYGEKGRKNSSPLTEDDFAYSVTPTMQLQIVTRVA